jgi:hypothetical protein
METDRLSFRDMRCSEKCDMFLRIERVVAAHRRGAVPQLKRSWKARGVIIWTRVMLKFPKPVLIPVVFWLYLEAKATMQVLLTFKEIKYFLEVLVKLRRPL